DRCCVCSVPEAWALVEGRCDGGGSRRAQPATGARDWVSTSSTSGRLEPRNGGGDRKPAPDLLRRVRAHIQRPQPERFHVKHDSVEVEPAAAVELFGDRIELARSYTEELASRGEELGLIGPLERPRLWTRHILNSALLAPLIKSGRVGDVGSGAGLPGLVL